MILDVHAELLSMSLQHTVAEEVETVRAGVLQRSLGLVDRKPEPGHDRARPRQSLGRVAAAEDDEVVGVARNVVSHSFRRQNLRKRFMQRLASNGLITTPCGVPRRLLLPPLMRRRPAPSRSSTGTLSHSLINRSTFRSTIRRAADSRRSGCGIMSKYFDRSASTTST